MENNEQAHPGTPLSGISRAGPRPPLGSESPPGCAGIHVRSARPWPEESPPSARRATQRRQPDPIHPTSRSMP